MLYTLLTRLLSSGPLSPDSRLRQRHPLVLEPLEDRTVPTGFLVSNSADSGTGSLRQALLDANYNPGLDSISFASSVHNITLSSGELAITESVTLQGSGANKLSISGNDASRVLNIHNGNVSISGLTITHGRSDKFATNLAGIGGGILNQAGASLSLVDVVLSNNQAVGDASIITDLTGIGGYIYSGGGVGGGVANLGTLSATTCSFVNNLARGGDGSVGPFYPNIIYPGLALGGGLYNLLASATLSNCHFGMNEAQAGSNCLGSFAGIGGGGAIYNDATLNVSGSSFSHNQAFGGDDTVADLHNGHALGGGIMSGSVTALFGIRTASVSVSQSSFDHNQVHGGSRNTTLIPEEFLGPVDGPNTGVGGGIVIYQGSASIGQSTLDHNLARGGDGMAGQAGGMAVGGGVFFLNFIGGVTASVTNSAIHHNDAIGGTGGAGARGGNALGGGVALGALGGLFAGPGALTLSNSTVDHNGAQGGQGGSGGNGGNGLGGGLFNDAGSTTTMTATAITHNQAKAGKGKGGGSDGVGNGGGVYYPGIFSADLASLIAYNLATTSNNDIYP